MHFKHAPQFILFLLYLASPGAFAYQYNLPQGVTPLSHDIYSLHMTIFWVCVAIGIVVFTVMFYAIINHRKSVHPKPAQFHEHLWVEITWTIIPVLILVAMAYPATRVLFRINDTEIPALTVKITGYQWKWRYEYLDYPGINFFSNLSTPYNQMHGSEPKGENYLREVDNPVVLPIHKKVRLLFTSNDVIHGWWVPELGVKQDSVPGFINENWTKINKPGIYRGQCVELCGLNHGYMPIVIIALSQKDFDAWVKQKTGGGTADVNKKLTKDELMKTGEQVYLGTCAACHKADGTGSPPVFPAMKGSKTATGGLPDHINTVLNGRPGTAMQSFRNQFSDEELAAVITYERNAFGNNTGTLVQPADIYEAKTGKKPTVVPQTAKTTAAAPVSAKLTLEQQMQKGEQVFNNTCAVCHKVDGSGSPPTFPALKDDKVVKGPLPAHIDTVLNGHPGTAMQAFRDQLTDAELSAVITYERNAFGNKSGEVIQPNDITLAKQQAKK